MGERPAIDELPQVYLPGVPLAICAILYSYEGINLILPVELAMQEPEKFKRVFLWAVFLVSLILAVHINYILKHELVVTIITLFYLFTLCYN